MRATVQRIIITASMVDISEIRRNHLLLARNTDDTKGHIIRPPCTLISRLLGCDSVWFWEVRVENLPRLVTGAV
jgi:hypothetical protein